MPAASSSAAAAAGASAHRRLFGASLVRHWPGLRAPARGFELAPKGLFLTWLAFVGLLLFAAVVLWQRGVWAMLIEADPTGLTVAIIVLFAACTGWVGRRAWRLCHERERLDEALLHLHAGRLPALAAPAAGAATVEASGHWALRYWASLLRPQVDASSALALLGERCHGPHEMAWWFNGIQLKLGLLGKVIGFSVLALQLGRMDSFDPSQSALLLKNLTGGLGIALLTTMTGLAGNVLLGLQLMRLDRYADALVADAMAAAHESLPAPGTVAASQPLATAAAEGVAHGDRPHGA